MKNLTALTDYETGEQCLIDLSNPTSVERLPAFNEDGQEEGARTKIVIGREMYLVRETIPEIRAAYEASHA